MERMVGDLFPLAVGGALSPMPIAALVLMLLSNRARVNSVMFLVGWVVGLAVLVFISSSLYAAAPMAGDSSSLKRIIDGGLGILLVIFALRQWEERTRPGQVPRVPKWMGAVENFSPGKALATGLLLATVNLKNTPIGIAVGADLAKYTASVHIAGLIFYLVVASSTIAIPTIGFLILGNKIQRPLESLKTWLITHNAAMMFVLFLLLGTMLISKAFGE